MKRIKRPPRQADSLLNELGHATAVHGAAEAPAARTETLAERVNRAKARWLKRVMYETPATSTEKCFAYAVADHLNCVTLDCWPSQSRSAELLGFKSVKTPQRAARGLEQLGVLCITLFDRRRYRYAPVFLPGDEDKPVLPSGHSCPEPPDKDVKESLLDIQFTRSASTEVAAEGSRLRSAFDRRQRGAVEIKIAQLIGSNGIEILSRLDAIDNRIVDRLCRAYVNGAFSDREAAAARLAAEQLGRP